MYKRGEEEAAPHQRCDRGVAFLDFASSSLAVPSHEASSSAPAPKVTVMPLCSQNYNECGISGLHF
ncbi:unnamed protein product [Musa acuminata subsp. malaccensis]|uniref:(wild Malaysian banana) hypothetical protein n=1 Tax=Musa acuminata subsp. malaccensis TaxID=214687 RepID=A0A804KVN8_MUSAM|nr:unnamed protein product [Musa acuminata subsp. malaccensis]